MAYSIVGGIIAEKFESVGGRIACGSLDFILKFGSVDLYGETFGVGEVILGGLEGERVVAGRHSGEFLVESPDGAGY